MDDQASQIRKAKAELAALTPPKIVSIEDFGFTPFTYKLAIFTYNLVFTIIGVVKFICVVGGILPCICALVWLISVFHKSGPANMTLVIFLTWAGTLWASNIAIEYLERVGKPGTNYLKRINEYNNAYNHFNAKRCELQNILDKIEHPYKWGLQSDSRCVVIDTETRWHISKGETPILKEFAYSIIQPDGFVLLRKNFYFYCKSGNKDNNCNTEKAQSETHHSIDIKTALCAFVDDVSVYKCECVIGHNLEFDEGILMLVFKNENMRFNVLDGMLKICTMKEGTHVTKIVNRSHEHPDRSREILDEFRSDHDMRFKKNKELYKATKRCILHPAYSPPPRGSHNYKYPTLQELYKFYTGNDITNWHNAQCDVDACQACFLKMVIR